LEFELLQFLKKKFAQQHRVSVERVVSGTGLANVYEFLSQRFPEKITKATHDKILAAGDMKGAIIAQNQATCELCTQTMTIFAAAYGSEAGVAGLKWLPRGGLYLTGGLTPKNLALLEGENSAFMKAFRDKGRVSGMLHNIPVFAVMSENLGERGAHRVAFQDFLSQVDRLDAVPAERSPAASNEESFSSRWFRRLGYAAGVYVASQITLGVVMALTQDQPRATESV
jgi:glucokinase